MKKLLILMFVVLGIAFQSQAQRATLMPLAVGDTIVNTGTVSKVITATAGYQGIGIQYNLTKISGTGAGTVGIYGSLDGTNYKQIGSDYTITNTSSQSNVVYITGPLPPYIKVLGTGSGTESVQMRVYYVLRKHD